MRVAFFRDEGILLAVARCSGNNVIDRALEALE